MKFSQPSQALILAFLSAVFFSQVLLPVFWWSAKAERFVNKKFYSPVVESFVFQNSQKPNLTGSIEVVKASSGFSYFKPTRELRQRDLRFKLSIPKLKIDQANALVDSVDFLNSLAHFPGTAIPGEVGNAFVTGHSVLPQFYDPGNYKTIFSKLDQLAVGDVVQVEVDGKILRFFVQNSKIVDPEDLSVLLPPDDAGSFLTLMTCVPPGVASYRLVVTAKLES